MPLVSVINCVPLKNISDSAPYENHTLTEINQ